jgi:hypothetical protein
MERAQASVLLAEVVRARHSRGRRNFMRKAHVDFKKIVQDSQDVRADPKAGDHMFCRVHFSLAINGALTENMYVDISQPFGTDYATEPLEVGPPMTADGPYNKNWNAKAFSDLVEVYYRELIGTQGRAVTTEGSASVRMRNNVLVFHKAVDFEIP